MACNRFLSVEKMSVVRKVASGSLGEEQVFSLVSIDRPWLIEVRHNWD